MAWVAAEMMDRSQAWGNGLKDQALLQLWLGFNPWPRIAGAAIKKKKAKHFTLGFSVEFFSKKQNPSKKKIKAEIATEQSLTNLEHSLLLTESQEHFFTRV